MQKVGKVSIKRFLAPPVLRDNRETTFEGVDGVCEKARDSAREKNGVVLGSTREACEKGFLGSIEAGNYPLRDSFSRKSVVIIEEREGIDSNRGKEGNIGLESLGLEKLSRATLKLPTSPSYKKSVADGEVYRLSHYSEKGGFATIINARDGKKVEIYAGVWENCFV